MTSNSFVADAYAKVIIGLLRDVTEAVSSAIRSDPREPVYIVEVGAGHAKLSFLIIRALMAMKDTFPETPHEYPFVVVATDVSKACVDDWRQQEMLQPLVKAGLLDFAVFNAETDKSLTLTESGTILRKGSSTNPMVLVCNYLFDSLVNVRLSFILEFRGCYACTGCIQGN